VVVQIKLTKLTILQANKPVTMSFCLYPHNTNNPLDVEVDLRDSLRAVYGQGVYSDAIFDAEGQIYYDMEVEESDFYSDMITQTGGGDHPTRIGKYLYRLVTIPPEDNEY
jgi:hypothetical protein